MLLARKWMVLLFMMSGSADSAVLNDQETKILSREKILIKNSENAPSAYLKYILDLALSPDGSLYLIDSNRVLKFGHDGVFIDTIGENGQGPGEYQNPRNLGIDLKNQLWVNDSGRGLLIYDSSGTFQRKISLETDAGLEAFEVWEGGRIIGVWNVWDENGQKKILKIIRENGEVDQVIHQYDFIKMKVNGVVGGIQHSFLPNLLFAVLGNGYYCYGNSMVYRIFIMDRRGKKIIEIERNERPESTRRERKEIQRHYGREYLAHYHLPEWKPFYERILVDDEKRIYVVRTRPMFLVGPPAMTQIDVFLENGKYVRSLKCSGIPKIVDRGRIYTIDTDEEDIPFVAIYHIPSGYL